MHKEHPVFIPPENKDAKIWRYVDFTKFISFIDNQALYFAQVNGLDDKFEGCWSKQVIASYIEQRKKNSNWSKFAPPLDPIKQWVFVNCWHLSEYESVAMWKIYLKGSEGLAIQSTYQRLVNSFKKVNDLDIFVGKVNYIDYEKDGMPSDNALYPFIYKRKIFEYEKELRAVIMEAPFLQPITSTIGTFYEEAHCNQPHGLMIPVDLEELIANIYLSPSAPSWFEDLVRSVLKKYGISMSPVTSEVNAEPTF